MDSSPLAANCARGEEKAVSSDCTDARLSCLRAEAAAAAAASELSPPPVPDDDDDVEFDVLLVLGLGLGVKSVARAVHAAH